MITIISVAVAIMSLGVAIWSLIRNTNNDSKLDQEEYNKIKFQVDMQAKQITELKLEQVEIKRQVRELDTETKKDMKEMEKAILGHIHSLDTKFERFDEKIDKLKDILLENRK